MRSFWYHYNKPATQKAGKPQITLHYQGACHIIDNIICNVKTMGRIRKSQPRWVIAGKAKEVTFKNKVAEIT